MAAFAPCLWFDGNAEEAARFYAKVFAGSVDKVVKAPSDYPSGKKGDVLLVEFTVMGQRFTGLNGGPYFKFNEAISLMVRCKDQAEQDHLWKALSAVPEAEQCGWVKDKFGVSWQVIPEGLDKLIADPDSKRAKRGFDAMMEMKKIDMPALQRAVDGK